MVPPFISTGPMLVRGKASVLSLCLHARSEVLEFGGQSKWTNFESLFRHKSSMLIRQISENETSCWAVLLFDSHQQSNGQSLLLGTRLALDAERLRTASHTLFWRAHAN